jgi:hypothetical protein
MPIFGGAFHALKKIWQDKKKAFKAATGEDKPGQKKLGFRLSAGLEPARAKVDDEGLKVWDAKTPADFTKAKASYAKAVAAFKTVKASYVQQLNQAKRGEPKYDAAIEALKKGLEDVAKCVREADAMSNKNGLS